MSTGTLAEVKPAQTEVKANLPIMHGKLQPQDFEGLWRLSRVIAASGLAPKGIQKPEQVFVQISHGLELGLSVMQSMQSIGIINGKPGIYGDALQALVEYRVPGQLYTHEEWFEGERDHEDWTAHCKTVRDFKDGRPKRTRHHKFSVADAKRADLWGKGTYKQYPARMLMWRARSYSFRDNFPDVLQGLLTYEEILNVPEQDIAAAIPAKEEVFPIKTREEQPEPVIIETEPTAPIEAHVTVIPDSADSEPTEPTTVHGIPTNEVAPVQCIVGPGGGPDEEPPEFERRRRTQDIGNGLKTAGMTGEQWIEIQDYRGKLALGAEIVEMWLDENLPTREKRCSYLREEEAQALIDHLAMAWERAQASAPEADDNEGIPAEADQSTGPDGAPDSQPRGDDTAPVFSSPPIEAYEAEEAQPSVKFRLGQHVETPSGIGIIEEIETENGKSRYFCRVVGENRIPVQEVFTESEIRPGRDPLEGGFSR